MPATADQLFLDALALPLEVRADLTDRIVASLAEVITLETERAHLAEVRRRVARARRPATYQFYPDARAEYHDAIRRYAAEAAGTEAATRFVAEVEAAVATICALPETWRIVEPPDVRRYVLRRFPFVLYYRYRAAENAIIVFAVMHASRQPGY